MSKNALLPIRPEFAFIGRSNVGKSSLINMLTGRRSLAKTSVKPGKTQTINHFLINEAWYLVDLPGYGYASVSKTLKAGFRQNDRRLCRHRENLTVPSCIDRSARRATKERPEASSTGPALKGSPWPLSLPRLTSSLNRSFRRTSPGFSRALLQEWESLPPMMMYFRRETNRTGRSTGFH